jgi:hypothetical protein
MTYTRPRRSNANVTCAVCGHRLIPLSYAVPPNDDPRGEERPALKCRGCSQRYRWNDSSDWEPVEHS